jgi:hypothetical protein
MNLVEFHFVANMTLVEHDFGRTGLCIAEHNLVELHFGVNLTLVEPDFGRNRLNIIFITGVNLTFSLQQYGTFTWRSGFMYPLQEKHCHVVLRDPLP